MSTQTNAGLETEQSASEALSPAELLRNNEALRMEIMRLRQENNSLGQRLAGFVKDRRSDREFRRAALNLMEDAVESRQRAQSANDERVRAENKLEETVTQRTLELRETVGELEAFSYSIAHDMRAPLRSMRGFGEVLQAEYGHVLDVRGQDFLRRITSAAERMDQLIRDVLSYSTIQRSHLPMGPLDVEKVLDGIIESYPLFSRDNVTIAIDKPLPKVLGNYACLTQCLANLLTNAVKFVASGVKAEVLIWAEKNGPSVRLFVKDNGIGIDPAYQQRIFGIFVQLDKSYGGTGIGLAIVKKSAERMGGKVGVESAVGKGSTFWLELELGNRLD